MTMLVVPTQPVRAPARDGAATAQVPGAARRAAVMAAATRPGIGCTERLGGPGRRLEDDGR